MIRKNVIPHWGMSVSEVWNMIKIEIEIDPEKARRECKYTPESMMNCLDSTFAKADFPILEADEFRRVYRDSRNEEDDYGVMGSLVLEFAKRDWFAACVKKIMWYDNDGIYDTDNWNVENWLESMKRDKYGAFNSHSPVGNGSKHTKRNKYE